MNCKLNRFFALHYLLVKVILFDTCFVLSIDKIILGSALAKSYTGCITCAFVAFFAGSSADRYNGQHEYYLFHTPNVNQ